MSRGSKSVKGAIVQYYRCNRVYSRSKYFDDRRDSAEDCSYNDQEFSEFSPDLNIKETNTKPCLRTEEAYHVVRIPALIRSRIHEMSAKKLPTPVIIMVLQVCAVTLEECHRFCTNGSALEQRILSITPGEVSAIANSSIGQENPTQECALSELELAVLEQYERNRSGVLSQFQLARREENRKR
ncbi:unnamed protein product [Cylicostephanus goldi]|uniref:Uncharacterized protein n=1 Tax=Cylicostephanus goldi TaxID=71465 RepID=A0A3P7PTB6_CYLGO|nr:unnamed protein product [Cylicostephanus goldi]